MSVGVQGIQGDIEPGDHQGLIINH